MVIKICGIKSIENIELISKLNIDMIGLNFYPPSVRYLGESYPSSNFDILPTKIKRVGVFVNEEIDKINQIAEEFKLDYIQLHGDEDVDFCNYLSKNHKIIKVFRIDEEFNISNCNDFDFVDYFLFDTATKHFGGSGKKFDWSKIDQYNGETPFLLSGGISPSDSDQVNSYIHKQYVGIDINSKFESQPGIKDSKLLIPFIDKVLYNNKSED